jgi:flagellar biosynthesis protein FlhB
VAEGGEEQDKSEAATPFKLERARRKGMVARGTDLGFVSALLGLSIAAELGGGPLIDRMVVAMRRSFAQLIPAGADAHHVAAIAGREMAATVGVLALPVLVLLVLGVLFELVQIRGLVFSAEPLKPDFSRLNPAKGLKRLFSMRMLKELGKNVLKFVVYVAAAFLFIRSTAHELAAQASSGGELARVLAHVAGRLLLLFIVLAAGMALLDQVLARGEFARQMRMSRREVTREVREREGEPRQKQRRKQILSELIKQASAAAGVKGADVLIVNPTHYAVALRYDPEEYDAPVIQARGRNAYARQMRDAARREGVAIVRNPRLARALYHRGYLGHPIGTTEFVAVADIYLMLRRALQAREGSA